jgi:hypothetical protein
VPLIAAGANAPGLPFLRRLNWVESPIITEDKALHRVLAALKGETVATTTPLWKLVNPYRGLEAMTEANADYFYGRNTETAALLSALAEKRGRCPILVGASGVGKSSVARAGVLSALKSMQWPGTERTAASNWPAGLTNSRALSLVVRPGEAPLEALAAAFIQLWQFDARDPDQAGLPRKWGRTPLLRQQQARRPDRHHPGGVEEARRRGARAGPPLSRSGRGALHPRRAAGGASLL